MVKYVEFTGGDFIMELKRKKSKISYTVMIVSDSAKKNIKKWHIKASAVGTVCVLLFMLVVFVICYMTFSSITLTDTLERNKKQMDQITVLKKENEELVAAKDALEGKVSILSETVNQKVEAEQEVQAKQEEDHLPKGFPLSGTAQMKNVDEEQQQNEENTTVPADDKGIVFTAGEGINVIASGAGTVLSVDVDAQFGNVISIDHGNGYISTYKNAAKPMVKLGQEVMRGDILYVIAEDNKEMEYSIQKDGTYIDPMEMIEING